MPQSHISEQNQTNNKIPGNPCKTGHSGAKQGETKQPPQSNLTYDDAVTYFFRNMEGRGLASETKHFYKDKLNAFRKFLVQIKKIQALETLTSS